MKKSVMLALCILTGMLFVASLALAYTPGAGIKTTPHDLSLLGGNGANFFGDTAEKGAKDRICVYCHAPHNTFKLAQVDGIDYIPLWNHVVTTQTYNLYSNGANNPSSLQHKSDAMIQLGSVGKPGGVSRLCLSCHDGSVAANAYGQTGKSSSVGAADKTIGAVAGYDKYVIGGGGDLTNHHPIGMDYDVVVGTDDEIKAKTSAMGTQTIGDLLWAGKMECTTCHDVHNTKNSGDKFIWIEDTNSAFCMACHDK